MARSITDPDRQASALTAVARALAQAGQHEQAAVVAAQAESVARSITDPDRQASALTAVAQALAQAGQHEQAAGWRPRPRAWPARSPTRTGGHQP